MTVLKHTLRLQLQNHALVLIWLSFPLSFPNDWTPFFPIRDSVRAEHVLLDHFGIHKRIPYFGNRGIDCNLCFSDQCAFHVFSNRFFKCHYSLGVLEACERNLNLVKKEHESRRRTASPEISIIIAR